ncbi:TPA: hypothetical protein ACN7P0_001863 [Klebsiella pneumoniae]|nr:hypothetical protein [Klebsiella pneumoniae]
MDSNNQTKSLNKILTNIRAGVSSDKEADVLAQIEQLKSQAESDHSQFIERFNESYLYYTARKPGKGIHQSRYVEPVLYNAVKAALPQLLDSFTSDDGLAVAFRSRGYRKNPMLENLITYNLNKIFLRDQDGYEILEGSFKTSLIAGDSFVKVYVDETTHKETATVEDWIDLIEFMTTIDEDWTINPPKSFGKDKSGSFKGFEWKEQVKTLVDQQTGQQIKQPEILIKGAVPLIKREKKLIVEELEPHDVWFDTAYGSDFSKCRYICHRVKTTVGEAKLRGFDADKLDKASDTKYEDSVLPDLFFSSVNYDSPTGAASGRMERNSSVDDNERPISLYEHYFYSSIPNKKNETRLYQAVTSGGELLSLEEIKRMPFVHGKCEPVQGSFFSRSFYDVCKPFQDNLSEMMRINLDKGAFTVYPRFRAVKGQYDRGSLQNNRPGAVIEELSSGAVQLFENYELPQTFALAQTNLKQSMSDTVAQSVGFANADGGVPQVATATAYLSIFQESQKGMVLTNNLKRTLVQPLYCLIYEIMRDEGFTLYAPDGSKVSGAELPALYDMIADPSTTHDDYAQNMQRQSVAAFVLQAAQANSPVMTPQNIYAIAKDMLETSDLDSSLYLSDPSQNQDPHAAAEQAAKAALEDELQRVQVETAKVQMRKLASEVFINEQKAEEMIRDGQANRANKQSELDARIQQIINDAQNKADFNQVKAQEVAVKNQQVINDTILSAHKQAYEINANRVNGRLH